MISVDAAAAGIKLQCGGEYGFGAMDEEDPRATQLYKSSVLFQSSQSVVDSITKKINKVLNNREKNWNVDQRTLQKERF